MRWTDLGEGLEDGEFEGGQLGDGFNYKVDRVEVVH